MFTNAPRSPHYPSSCVGGEGYLFPLGLLFGYFVFQKLLEETHTFKILWSSNSFGKWGISFSFYFDGFLCKQLGVVSSMFILWRVSKLDMNFNPLHVFKLLSIEQRLKFVSL